jgi:hypothetical protein
LDRKPASPLLASATKDNNFKLYVGDIEEILKGQGQQQLSSKNIIVCDDDGDDTLRGYNDKNKRDKSDSLIIINKLVKCLPSSISSMLCISSEINQAGGLFGPKGTTELKKWCTSNSKPFTNFRYGKLTGGVPGAEPLPFLGLPALEPELHPSYVLRSVVLSDPASNKYSVSEISTRDSISEAACRYIDGGNTGLDALVVSTIGEPLSDNEWNRQFIKLSSVGNAELLVIDFGSITKPQQMISWITDTWFPQALIEADAATVYAGARPVRATKTSPTTVQIKWEDLSPTFDVIPAGGLEITLETETNPSLRVIRLNNKPLPGEVQLMDKLVESINKQVYKKQFATPKEN